MDKLKIEKCLKGVLEDYNKDLLFREGDLKSCLYYHIKKIIDNKHFIYTELKVYWEGTRKACDLAICNRKLNNEEKLNINDDIEAVFELKYTTYYNKAIKEDLKKLKEIRLGKDKYFIMIYEWQKSKILELLGGKKTNFPENLNVYFIIWEKSKDTCWGLYCFKDNDLTEI